MQVELEGVEELRLADGSPVRAASAVAPFGDGFLVVQDDATHGAWVRGLSVESVRLLPAVDDLELFGEASGTKHLKPDLEAACAVEVEGEPCLLAMGSGSLPARMRWSLVRPAGGSAEVVVADMGPLYAAVGDALAVPPDVLNLEGACLVGDVLRWYHRGLPAAGLRSGSVDLDPDAAVAAVLGRIPAGAVDVANPTSYDLGALGGAALAVTDAVTLPDGSVLLSVAAEDTSNPRDDGPVLASALVRVDDVVVRETAQLPLIDGQVAKVEGLMVLDADDDQARLLAVVDVDDPSIPSLALRLRTLLR